MINFQMISIQIIILLEEQTQKALRSSNTFLKAFDIFLLHIYIYRFEYILQIFLILLQS
jgi:hypothetical protein